MKITFKEHVNINQMNFFLKYFAVKINLQKEENSSSIFAYLFFLLFLKPKLRVFKGIYFMMMTWIKSFKKNWDILMCMHKRKEPIQVTIVWCETSVETTLKRKNINSIQHNHLHIFSYVILVGTFNLCIM
jgi:hypothetical protein